MKDGNIDKMLHSIAKGTTIVFLGMLVGTVLTYLTKMVIARTFGPEGYGVLRLGLSVIYIGLPITIMGLSSGVSRYVSFYRARSDYEGIKGTLISASKATLLTSIGVGAILFFTAPLLSSMFHEPQITEILRILAIFIPFLVLGRILQAGLRGFRRMDYLVYSNDLVLKGGKLTLVCLAAIIGYGILGLSLAYSLSFVIALVASFCFLKRCFQKEAKWKKLQVRPLFRKLFNFSYPLMIGESISQFRQRTDTIMLGYFKTARHVGIYNAALPIVRLLQTGLYSINRIFMPSISELYATGKIDEIRQIYTQVAKWAFYLAFPLFLSMVFFAEEFLVLLFGKDYQSGGVALQILAIGVLVGIVSGSFGETLIAIGKTKVNMFLSIIGVLVNIILNLLLIPRLAINGAALATSMSSILVCICSMSYLFRNFRIHPFSWRHLQFTAIFSVLAAILYPMASYGISRYGSWFIVPFLVALYLIGLFLFYITKGFNALEKQILMKIISKVTPNKR